LQLKRYTILFFLIASFLSSFKVKDGFLFIRSSIVM
jgi:hypothetical protein